MKHEEIFLTPMLFSSLESASGWSQEKEGCAREHVVLPQSEPWYEETQVIRLSLSVYTVGLGFA